MRRYVPTVRTTVLRRILLVTSAVSAVLLGAGAAGASAQQFLPPTGKVFAGVAGQPISSYTRAVGKHPSVYQEFLAWGQYLPTITQDATNARARLMIHISTSFGSSEVITPAGIAAGQGDSWLIGLNHALFGSRLVVYVRLMAEMDTYWNVYGAFNADGSRRDQAHSTAAYRAAWKRVTLVLRGGPLAHIDSVLRRLGMPRLRAGHDLPRPKVAMLWVPQVAGAPDIRGNEPSDYFPGSPWVDWVGTDFYGNSPNFTGLTRLYNAYPAEPFVFGEFALWGADLPGFVDQLFGWTASHPRTRMLIYNQGVNPVGPFRLTRYPSSARELRRLLASPKFPAFAPEFQR